MSENTPLFQPGLHQEITDDGRKAMEGIQEQFRKGDDAARQVFQDATAIDGFLSRIHDPLKTYVDSGYPAPAGALAGGMKREHGQPFEMTEPMIAYDIPLTPGTLIHTFEDGAQLYQGAHGHISVLKSGVALSADERQAYAREYMHRSMEVAAEKMDSALTSPDAPILPLEVTPHDGPVQAFGHTTTPMPLTLGQAEAPVPEKKLHMAGLSGSFQPRPYQEAAIKDLKKVGTVAHVHPAGKATAAALTAMALQAAETSPEALEIEQRTQKLKKRLERLISPSKDRKDLKRVLRTFERKKFGPVMDVRVSIPDRTFTWQRGEATTTGENIIRWMYKTNEHKDLGNFARFLGHRGGFDYGRPWTYELAAVFCAEILWSLVLRVPELVEGSNKLDSLQRLDVCSAAIDAIERAVTGRVAL